MLAVSPLRINPKDEREGEMEGFSMEESEFPDFSDSNLLDSIDFDDLFLGINEGDVLPDLEMDPEILADFSLSASDDSEARVPSLSVDEENRSYEQFAVSDVVSVSSSPEETVSRKNESDHKPRKPTTSHSKNPHGKRKVKVDWTPELHRRFVQAVEQLGVDKAVPSRILELMGIDCLTRHNIASHLQKYRSHRKHLLAREAEAASWSQQRRQLYGGAGKRNPWSTAPTMGFPPVTPAPVPMPHHHFRPLHVWGHPSVDHSMMPMWPKHLNPPWPAHPPPPPSDSSFWIPHPHPHHVPTPGTPCFPPHLPPARFPGIPPGGMYKVEQGFPTPQTLPQPPSDIHPSKESVDAAIGDVLSKPWLPLPLGLKPPSVDGVMVELQRQGISNVPPSCA
ncbi:hypothetical protein ACS0TY_031819 [Phlomoides rotata]